MCNLGTYTEIHKRRYSFKLMLYMGIMLVLENQIKDRAYIPLSMQVVLMPSFI